VVELRIVWCQEWGHTQCTWDPTWGWGYLSDISWRLPHSEYDLRYDWGYAVSFSDHNHSVWYWKLCMSFPETTTIQSRSEAMCIWSVPLLRYYYSVWNRGSRCCVHPWLLPTHQQSWLKTGAFQQCWGLWGDSLICGQNAQKRIFPSVFPSSEEKEISILPLVPGDHS